MSLGVVVLGFGLLLVPTSSLGGFHIAVAGLALLLSGVFATEWTGDRLGLSAADRRKLSVAFAAVAAILLALFVVINWATFETAEFESSG